MAAPAADEEPRHASAVFRGRVPENRGPHARSKDSPAAPQPLTPRSALFSAPRDAEAAGPSERAALEARDRELGELRRLLSQAQERKALAEERLRAQEPSSPTAETVAPPQPPQGSLIPSSHVAWLSNAPWGGGAVGVRQATEVRERWIAAIQERLDDLGRELSRLNQDYIRGSDCCITLERQLADLRPVSPGQPQQQPAGAAGSASPSGSGSGSARAAGNPEAAAGSSGKALSSAAQLGLSQELYEVLAQLPASTCTYTPAHQYLHRLREACRRCNLPHGHHPAGHTSQYSGHHPPPPPPPGAEGAQPRRAAPGAAHGAGGAGHAAAGTPAAPGRAVSASPLPPGAPQRGGAGTRSATPQQGAGARAPAAAARGPPQSTAALRGPAAATARLQAQRAGARERSRSAQNAASGVAGATQRPGARGGVR